VQSGYLAEQLAGVTVAQLFGRERATAAEFERLGGRYLRATKTANWYDASLYSLMDGISALCVALLIYFAAPELFPATAPPASPSACCSPSSTTCSACSCRSASSRGSSPPIQRAVASLERVYGLLDEPAEPRLPAAPPILCAPSPAASRSATSASATAPDAGEVLRGHLLRHRPRRDRRRRRPHRLRQDQPRPHPHPHLRRLPRPRPLTCRRRLRRGPRRQPRRPPPPRPHGPAGRFPLQRRRRPQRQPSASPASRRPRGRIEAALRTVQAADFVAARGGLGFVVGERGRNLSSGEAQLLAFARVAARSPTFLILDEATASVDSMTEHKVQAAIEELLRGRSVLVIAHRLSTVRRADKILVMQAGEVVEQGTHEDLLARGGVYAELYRMGLDAA
jgi:ABC-type multidrug transport system fused ATPase/permease subunit